MNALSTQRKAFSILTNKHVILKILKSIIYENQY